MADREMTVIEIKEVFRLRAKGHGIKRIARTVGISRNTVRRYLQLAEKEGLAPSNVMEMEDHRVAGDDEVPPLLRTHPASRAALPSHWQALEELSLRGSGKVLSAKQFERLGYALRASSGQMTPELQEVREALEPVSRGALGWQWFTTTRSETPSWIRRSFRVLYDDASIERLAQEMG